ncbi:MAG: acyl-CoA/acyl-ACP dehydrogenase [Pseudomonadota bacterium]|nr:acyl-CoA/acyl-ACP dehydrogenase [Pseudomonadota bacterium]
MNEPFSADSSNTNRIDSILSDSTRRLFADHFPDAAIRASRDGVFSSAGWESIDESGLPLALLSENAGGFGLTATEALDAIRIGASFASPLPLAETMIANYLLADAGLPTTAGPATFAELSVESRIERESGRWRLTGAAHGVPWARGAQTIVVAVNSQRARVALRDCRLESNPSLSGLPRDTVHMDLLLDEDAVGNAADSPEIRILGAAIRVLEIAGALESVLAMTTAYAGERIQFGKPVGKQQAIQQQLAVLASQAAAANCAAEIAAAAFGTASAASAVAVAKSRAGEAASRGAAIAHQVHGAIGFAAEHRLHLFTTALWTWRDEFGSELYWNRRLGAHALLGGADNYWPFITSMLSKEAR